MVFFSCHVHDVYLLLKLEDKCHLWITDSLRRCECGGGAVRRLVVNVWSRLQPGPRDSNCFSAVLGWMEHIMWHFLSFSLLVKPHPLDSLRHPCPEAPTHMIQLTQEERARPYVHIYISRHRWPLHSQHVNALQGWGITSHISHFLFHKSHLRAWGGQKWWMNDLLMIP